jgi:hypothetical protein
LPKINIPPQVSTGIQQIIAHLHFVRAFHSEPPNILKTRLAKERDKMLTCSALTLLCFATDATPRNSKIDVYRQANDDAQGPFVKKNRCGITRHVFAVRADSDPLPPCRAGWDAIPAWQ